jgi:phage baseplate assembly protein W
MAANTTTNLYGKVQETYNIQAVKSQRKAVYGLDFPLGSNATGGIFSKSSGLNMIKNSVHQLLLTERGERVMLPNYGCNLRKYLFQPLDETTFQSIRREIEVSFRNYIVGAKIAKLGVFPTGDAGPAGGNSLQVVLTLKLDNSDLQMFDVGVTIS